jgi:hypothetical protein
LPAVVLPGGAHVDTLPKADFIKENNIPQAVVKPFGKSYGQFCARMATKRSRVGQPISL